VSKALTPLSNDLRRREARLPNVITLTKNTHFALYSAIIDALGDWPDTELPRGLLYGMPIVGDIPDTGILKPVGFREPLYITILCCHEVTVSTQGRPGPREQAPEACNGRGHQPCGK